MIGNKDLLKLVLLIALGAGLVMALGAFRESFSQNATDPHTDWLLRIYLGCGMLAAFGLALVARNRKGFLKLIWFRVRWQLMYLILAASFLLVGATNVTDYALHPADYDKVKILAHMITTGLVAASGLIIVWHYFPSRKRWVGIMFGVSGVSLFVYSLFSSLSIAWGETAISACFFVVLWVIINEQIDKL